MPAIAIGFWNIFVTNHLTSWSKPYLFFIRIPKSESLFWQYLTILQYMQDRILWAKTISTLIWALSSSIFLQLSAYCRLRWMEWILTFQLNEMSLRASPPASIRLINYEHLLPIIFPSLKKWKYFLKKLKFYIFKSTCLQLVTWYRLEYDLKVNQNIDLTSSMVVYNK